jgi:GNAT superfamily N-acetyltransferase
VPMPGGLRPASFQRVCRVWRDLVEAPGAFQGPGCTIAPGGSAGEAGRVSVVQFGDATAVVVPPAMVSRFSDLVASRPGCDLTDSASVENLVGPVAGFLGPATLAYADDACFQPREVQGITMVPAGNDAVLGLTEACRAEDTEESAIARVTSPVSVIQHDGKVVAACGYEVWAASLAHIGVLTHPQWRGQGLATGVASSCVAQALQARLVAQWRARCTLTASRRIARSLGFVELGRQLSFWLA